MRQLLRSVFVVACSAFAFAVPAAVFAPHANAADTWAAISWSPPEGVGGTGTGATQDYAIRASVSFCVGSKGTACTTVISAENACIAVAANGDAYAGGQASTLNAARTSAENALPGSTSKIAACADVPVAPPAPEKQAPAHAEPAGRDTDGDGLSNRDEIGRLTNTFLWDTDLDGVSDGDEVKNGTNPLLIFDN